VAIDGHQWPSVAIGGHLTCASLERLAEQLEERRVERASMRERRVEQEGAPAMGGAAESLQDAVAVRGDQR
jgi:hypothetical protein